MEEDIKVIKKHINMKQLELILLLLCVSCVSTRHLTTNDLLGLKALDVWTFEYIRIKGRIPTKEEFSSWNNDGIILFLQEDCGLSSQEAKKFVRDSIQDKKKEWEYEQMVDLSFDFIVANIQSKMIASHYLSQHNKTIKFFVDDSSLKVIDYKLIDKNGIYANFETKLNYDSDDYDSDEIPELVDTIQ